MIEKAYLNWSSGKDASLSLYRILQTGNFSVEKLVTTINTDFDRISMHGIRVELLRRQAESLQIPLQVVPLGGEVSLDSYNKIMEEQVSNLQSEGFVAAVFGDIFLEDLKDYREKQLKKFGIKPVFPLWKEDTTKLALEFLELGFKAIVVCVNAKLLDESFCGRLFDKNFLSDLPKEVDPCGENGEFHTFVFDGPIFKNPIDFKLGEKVLRDFSPNKNEDEDCFSQPQTWDSKFWFVDLFPKV